MVHEETSGLRRVNTAKQSEKRGRYRAKRSSRTERIALLLGALVVISAITVSIRPLRPPKAVIVDQLSLTVPNSSFVKKATDLLQNAGYTVDYFPGAQVTVEFFRNLPSAGYELIVLRVHSARRNEHGVLSDDATLFTAQLANRTTYATEMAAQRIGAVIFTDGAGPYYFGVRPAFIEQDARGRFKNLTTIVLMGCDGLRSDALANAFITRGAKNFISWDRPVSASHTDKATLRLLEHLLLEKRSVPDSVSTTTAEIGLDPIHGSRLVYYTR